MSNVQRRAFTCLSAANRAFVFLSLCLPAMTQGDPEARVSSDSLTGDQIAVYRTVLEDYMKDSAESLNLADRTEPLELSPEDPCARGIKLEQQSTVIHRTTRGIAPKLKLVLVDPERQQKVIKQNDPQKLMKSAIEDHKQLSAGQIEAAVKNAVDTGLFTLSEIAFDKEHRHAVVSYSFVCGSLCGHGDKLILERVREKWRVKRRCGGWVS